jgi:hypothetical protein
LKDNSDPVTAEYNLLVTDVDAQTTTTTYLGEITPAEILANMTYTIDGLTENAEYEIVLQAIEPGTANTRNSNIEEITTTLAQNFAASANPSSNNELGLTITITPTNKTITSTNKAFTIQLEFAQYSDSPLGGPPETFRMNTLEPVTLTWNGAVGNNVAAGSLQLVSQWWVNNTTHVLNYVYRDDAPEVDGSIRFSVSATADGQTSPTEVGFNNDILKGGSEGTNNQIIFEMIPPALEEGGFAMKDLDADNTAIAGEIILTKHVGAQFIFTFNEVIKLDGKRATDMGGLSSEANTALANSFMEIVTSEDPVLAALITNLRDGNPSAKPTISLVDKTDPSAHSVVTVTWTFPRGSSGYAASQIKSYIATLKDYLDNENVLKNIFINLNNTLVTDLFTNVMKAITVENDKPKFQINRAVPRIIDITMTGLQADAAGYANCGEGGTLQGYINENSSNGTQTGFKIDITFDKEMNSTNVGTNANVKLVKLSSGNNGFTDIAQTVYTTPSGNTNPAITWSAANSIDNSKLTWTVTGLEEQDAADYTNLYVMVNVFAGVSDGPAMLPTVTYSDAGDNATIWNAILEAKGAMLSFAQKPFRLDLIDEFKGIAFNNLNGTTYTGVEPITSNVATIHPKHESTESQTLGVALMLSNPSFASLFNDENNKVQLTKVQKYETGYQDVDNTNGEYFATGTPISSVTDTKLCKINSGGDGYDASPKHPGIYIPIDLGATAKNPANYEDKYNLTFTYTNSVTGRAKTCTLETYVDYTQPTITDIGVKDGSSVSNDDQYINRDTLNAATGTTITREYLIIFDKKIDPTTLTTSNLRLHVEDETGVITPIPGYVTIDNNIAWDATGKLATVTISLLKGSLWDINYNKISLEVINHESVKSTTGATLDKDYVVDNGEVGAAEESAIKSAYIIDAVTPLVQAKPYNTDYEYSVEDNGFLKYCAVDVINSHRLPNDKFILTFGFEEDVVVSADDLADMLKIGLEGYEREATGIKYYNAEDVEITDLTATQGVCRKIVFTYDIGSASTAIDLVTGPNAIKVVFDNSLNFVADKAGNKINFNSPTLVRSIYYDIEANNTDNVLAVTNGGTVINATTTPAGDIFYISKECKVRFTVGAYNEHDTYIVKLVKDVEEAPIPNPDLIAGIETNPPLNSTQVSPNGNILTTTLTLAEMFPNNVWTPGDKYYIVVKTLDQAQNKTVATSGNEYTVAKNPALLTAIKPPKYDEHAATPQLADKKIRKIEFTVDTDADMSDVVQAGKEITFTPTTQQSVPQKYTLSNSDQIGYNSVDRKVTLTLATPLELPSYSSLYNVKIQQGAFINVLGSPMAEATWTIKTLPQLDVVSVEYVQADGTSFAHNPAQLRFEPPTGMYNTLGIKITFNQNITFSQADIELSTSYTNLYGSANDNPLPFVYEVGNTHNDPKNVIILKANRDGDITAGMYTANPPNLEVGADLLIRGETQYTPTLSDNGKVIAGGVELTSFPSFTPNQVVNQVVRVDAVRPVITKDFGTPSSTIQLDDNLEVPVNRTFAVYTPENIDDLTVFKVGNNTKGFTITDHNISPTGTMLWIRGALGENQAFEEEITNIDYTNTAACEALKFPALPEGGYFIRLQHTDKFENTNDQTEVTEGVADYYFVVDKAPVITAVENATINMIVGNASSFKAMYGAENTKEFRYRINEQFLNINTDNKGKTTLTFTKENDVRTAIVETHFVQVGTTHNHKASIFVNPGVNVAKLYNAQGEEIGTLAGFLEGLTAGIWNINVKVTDKCGNTSELENAMSINVRSKPYVVKYRINGTDLIEDGSTPAKYVLPNDGKVGFTGNTIDFIFDRNILDYNLSTFTTYPDFEYSVIDDTLRMSQKSTSLLTSNTEYQFQLPVDVVKEDNNIGIDIGNVASNVVLMKTDYAIITGIDRIISAGNTDDPGEYIQAGDEDAYFRITFNGAINPANLSVEMLDAAAAGYVGVTVHTISLIPNKLNEICVYITGIPTVNTTAGNIKTGPIKHIPSNTPYVLQFGATHETYSVNRTPFTCTAHLPATNAQNVAVDADIVLTFDRAFKNIANAPTLNAAYTLTAGGGTTNLTVKSNTANTITYGVANGYLAYAAEYTISQVTNTLTDLWGNTCQPIQTWKFKTKTAPVVKHIVRANQADEYTKDASVDFTVELADAPTVAATVDDFSIIWNNGTAHTATVTDAVEDPNNPKIYTVTVSIPDNAKGELGLKYSGNVASTTNETYNVNRKPLTCTYFPTSDGNTSVSSVVSLTFSDEIVNPTTAPVLTANNNISLTSGTVDQDNNKITYSVANNGYWAYNTQYTISVGANNIVTDLWGNTCTVEGWTFKTEKAPVVEHIVRGNPTDQFTKEALVNFTVTFDKAPVFAITGTTGHFTHVWNPVQTLGSITNVVQDNNNHKVYTVTVSIPDNAVGELGLRYNNAQATITNETYDVNRKVLQLTKTPTGTNVAVNTTNIVLTYTSTLANGTVAPTLKLKEGNTSTSIAAGTVDVNAMTITYTLPALAHGTTYEVEVTAGTAEVTDKWGNTNELENWTFTTVPAPPAVIATNPGTNGTGITVNLTTITITFDKDVTATNNVSLILYKGTTPTATMTSANVNGAVATFTLPTGTVLDYETVYTAKLAAGSFHNSNVVNNAYEWSFTTEDVPVVTSIEKGAPTSKYTNAASVAFKVTFDKVPAFALTTDMFSPVWTVGNASQSGTSIYSVTPTNDPGIYTVTVSIPDNAVGELGLRYGTQADPSTNDKYNVNRTALICNSCLPTGTDVAVNSDITLTFNRALKTTTAPGITVNNTSYAGVISSNTITYDLPILAYETPYNVAIVSNGTVADDWGNTYTITNWNFTTESKPVVNSIKRSNPTDKFTSAASVVFEVTFNKTPLPVLNTGDFGTTLNGCLVSEVSSINSVYTVTVTIPDNAEGTLGLTVPTYTVPSPGGNNNETYDVNRKPLTYASSPTNGATITDLNTDIVLTFNNTLKPTTNVPTLVVNGNSYNGVVSGKTITYTLPTLTYGSTYTVDVTNPQVIDLWNNTCNVTSWSFNVPARPAVASSTPTGTGVAINTQVTITFDMSVQLVGTAATATLTPSVGNSITLTNGTLSGGNKLTFILPNDLAYNTTYTLSIGADQVRRTDYNITNAANNSIATFTTVAAPATPPVVIGKTPTGTTVAVNLPTITVTFDRPVIVNTPSLTLYKGGTAVATITSATLSNGNATATFTLTSGTPLTYGTVYTVTLAANSFTAASLGNEVETWNFTTESKPVVDKIKRFTPTVELTSAASVVFEVTFNKPPQPVLNTGAFGTTLNGCSVSGVSSIDNVYKVTVSIPNNAEGTLGLTVPTYTVPSPGTNNETYNVNRKPLTCVIAPQGIVTDLTTDITLTFDRSLATTAPTLSVNGTNYTGTGSSNVITYALPNLEYGKTYNVSVVSNGTVADDWGNTYTVTDWSFNVPARPAVASSTPTGTGVAINTQVTITFDRSVQLVGTAATATLTGGGSTITLTNGTLSGGNKLTFILPNNLAYGTTYTLGIGADQVRRTDYNITNAANNSIATFTTEAAPAAPIVSSSVPGNVTNVDVNTQVSVTFNQTIELATTPAKVTLTNVSSGSITTLEATTVTGNNQLTFTLPSNLAYGTQYRLGIAAGQVKNSANVQNAANANIATFTTKALPTVSTTNPVSDATGVTVNLNQITVTFDKAVAATINVNLTLSQGGTAVATITSATVNGSVATFAIPSTVTLDGNTQYTATLAANSFTASGLGNAAHTWNFTTGAAGPSTLLLTLSSTRNTVTVSWASQNGVTYTATLYSDANYQNQVGNPGTVDGNGSDVNYTFTNLTRNTMYYVIVTSANEEGEGSIATRKYKESIVSINGIFEISEVTPMPIKTDAQFSLATSKAGHLTVTIYGLAGEKLMDVLSIDLNAGDEILVPMSFANFASGTYTLVVRLDGEMIQRRIVINK